MRGNVQDLLQQGKTYRGAILVRRQTKIQGDNRWFMLPQNLQRRFAVTGNFYIIILETPAQLGLQPGIIFNNQQFSFRSIHLGSYRLDNIITLRHFHSFR